MKNLTLLLLISLVVFCAAGCKPATDSPAAGSSGYRYSSPAASTGSAAAAGSSSATKSPAKTSASQKQAGTNSSASTAAQTPAASAATDADGKTVRLTGDWPIDNSKSPVSERVGVTYWGSKYIPDYAQTKSGFASAIGLWNRLGTKVVKIAISETTKNYPFDTWDMSAMGSLETILAQAPYKSVFAQNYLTYLLVTYEPKNVVWADGINATEKSYVTDQFYNAAEYLFATYQGTGKTFLLQNWEADNMLASTDGGDTAVQGLTDYLNARQDGIKKAQEEFGFSHNVNVFGALEVNRLITDTKVPKVVDAVVPNTHADLYFYSCYEKRDMYDIGDNGADKNLATIKTWTNYALTKLAAKAPDSTYYGSKNIAISEFGYPAILGQQNHPTIDGDAWQKTVAQATIEAGSEWGVQYMAYWQMYDNEQKNESITDWTKLRNNDMNGYWLVRPDGSVSSTYNYLKTILTKNSLT